MIDLYTWGTPNGQKASIMLCETGLPHRVHPIDLRTGMQRAPAYLAINPNGKIPAIVDHDPPAPVTLFESGAILIYLAEKSGRLLGDNARQRAAAIAWTFWQVGGIGPMLGQWMHFSRAAPEPLPYAVDRFRQEVDRLLGLLDQHLGEHEYLAEIFSIADIANFTWATAAMRLLGAADPNATAGYTHIAQWLARVGERPGVIEGMAIPAVA
ncbi:glutathione S-transferase family protein [Dyella sp.]|jgi:GST-like protein|uniref:glutathione S-transferase family protein n=1 Tax=Dyella sp. TaxID=1869338 RepID=UPI002D78D4C1|nr:glutathione S-transferase N-terminal domain-containing protein [Dyella sp.]HET6433793.1 glutathione S-transferase N-terminal domain-containing protein [Dyella sp.]